MYRMYDKSARSIKKLTTGDQLFLKNCNAAETLHIMTPPVHNGTHYVCEALLLEKYTAGGKTTGPWYRLWSKQTKWEKQDDHTPIRVELRFNAKKKRVRLVFPLAQQHEWQKRHWSSEGRCNTVSLSSYKQMNNPLTLHWSIRCLYWKDFTIDEFYEKSITSILNCGSGYYWSIV